MKTILLFIAVAFLAYACGGGSQQAEKSAKPEIDPSQLVEVSLDVKGMTCTGCENSIVRALASLDGVYEADADFQKELVVVKFDPALVNIEQITDAITRTGYQVLGEKDHKPEEPA